MLSSNKIYESIIFRQKKYVSLGLLQRATCLVGMLPFELGLVCHRKIENLKYIRKICNIPIDHRQKTSKSINQKFLEHLIQFECKKNFKSIPVLLTVIFSLITILTTNFKYFHTVCFRLLCLAHFSYKRKTYSNYCYHFEIWCMYTLNLFRFA